MYRGFKVMEEDGEALQYFGKAKNSLLSRYRSRAKIAELGAEVIEGLENIPNNAIALGVEQLLVDLNGGVFAMEKATSNINYATVKQAYILEAMGWLDKNLPGWETKLVFPK